MRIVKVAIQCKDKQSGERGTYGYVTNINIAVTPVFSDMIDFIEYCRKNNIYRNYGTGKARI